MCQNTGPSNVKLCQTKRKFDEGKDIPGARWEIRADNGPQAQGGSEKQEQGIKAVTGDCNWNLNTRIRTAQNPKSKNEASFRVMPCWKWASDYGKERSSQRRVLGWQIGEVKAAN